MMLQRVTMNSTDGNRVARMKQALNNAILG